MSNDKSKYAMPAGAGAAIAGGAVSANRFKREYPNAKKFIDNSKKDKKLYLKEKSKADEIAAKIKASGKDKYNSTKWRWHADQAEQYKVNRLYELDRAGQKLLTPKVLAPALAGAGVLGAAGLYRASKKISKAYDPEKNRAKRADAYTVAGVLGSGGSAYVAGRRFYAAGGGGHLRQSKNAFGLAAKEYKKSKARTGRAAAANRVADIKRAKALKDVATKHVVSAGKIVRTRPVLVPLASAAGLAATAGGIQYQKKNSGRSYSGWYDQKKKPKFSRVDNTTATSN